MSNTRLFGAAAALAGLTFFGVYWWLKPASPRLVASTFHRVDVNSRDDKLETSSESENDGRRDKLRNDALDAANVLVNAPCDPLAKARYIEAATKYVRGWFSVAPCMAEIGRCNSDGGDKQLDRVQQVFGTPLDRRVREAMQRAHETDAIVEGDFPRDTLLLLAQMAADPVISPYAEPRFQVSARERRPKLACRAAALR